MKILLVLFPMMAFASLPTPPSFLERTPTEKLYKAEYKGGYFGSRFGADVSMREVSVYERHPKLYGVHADLVKIIDTASRHVDLIVFEGCRTKAKQIQYVKEGKSKCDPRKGCNARHLKCAAVDVVFKHKSGKVNWSWEQSIATIKYLRGIGAALGIKCLRDGSSWDKGLDVSKTKFRDGFHLEKRANCSSYL